VRKSRYTAIGHSGHYHVNGTRGYHPPEEEQNQPDGEQDYPGKNNPAHCRNNGTFPIGVHIAVTSGLISSLYDKYY
jgi:hypothetical protein